MCGSKGPKDLAGDALREAVAEFAEALKPHIAVAEQYGITIGIENHGSALIETPDSMKWLVEYTRSPYLGIALAPYHLPNNAQLVSQLIEDLGAGWHSSMRGNTAWGAMRNYRKHRNCYRCRDGALWISHRFSRL